MGLRSKAEKASIRKRITQKLENHDKNERSYKSSLIKEKLFSTGEFKKARCVMFYVSTPSEVETGRMIDAALKAGKRIAVPYSENRNSDIAAAEINDRKELEKGPFGILQPKKEIFREVPIKDIDLVVVPGVAFDPKGERLGRGKGHYDKFLWKLPPDKPTIGLAFDFQIVDRLPRDSHDIPVSRVITN